MKQLVLVVGVGRSGTSLFTGILSQLGFHVPQPEVEADDTNPRGFSEPRFAVDFHTELLQRERVTVNDSRPKAFEKTGKAADDDAVRSDLGTWLEGELRAADAVVVKDPRTGWFLPLWTHCVTDLGADPRFVTMLRHPAEIIASARKSYGTWQPPASRAAAWINMTLETERATRGGRRAFVRYEDLMDDWRRETNRVGTLLDLPMLVSPNAEQAAAVDAFVDPTLHRNRVTWDEYDMPASVRDLAEQVWRELQPLADPQGDTPELHAKLDEARAAYAKLYEEAEAIAHSTVAAARPRKGKKPKPPPPLRARLARRVRSLGRS
jgi:hypothetical protein